MQHGLFISPAMFRTFVKPRVKKLVDLAHSHRVKFLLPFLRGDSTFNRGVD